MIRLCELTGLTQADMTEITAFLLGLCIAAFFIGNVLFWTLREFLKMSEKLIDSAVDLLFKYIKKRWHK